jgi:P27 family predicted phage terminase small subunit
MSGPPPTSTALKILRGNPGRRRLNSREPRPAIELPTCPAHLSAEARREWRRIGPQLRDIGVLSTIDKAAFAAYCVNWARWVKAEQKIKSQGEVLRSKRTGVEYYNPWLGVASRSMLLMHKFAIELGLSPSARSRVRSAEAAGDRSAFDEYLSQG